MKATSNLTQIHLTPSAKGAKAIAPDERPGSKAMKHSTNGALGKQLLSKKTLTYQLYRQLNH
jgi:hypothetical protein